MNCSNCHLDAGTKPWGNNYGSVFSTYPKMGRSGQIEGISKRINDCFERSLNGSALNEEDKEMKAMIAYIEYIGKDVPKGEDANSSEFMI
jgi:thiosulfate dehydrogenase